MANYEAQIKPTGLKTKSLVDCLYAVISSLKGIAIKLDNDGGVPLTTYEANIFTAIFNGEITNSRGERISNFVSTKEDRYFIAGPTGISKQAILGCLYQVFDMMETLTEQLDTDTLTDADYESLVYTAHYLWTIENEIGGTVGASTEAWIRPGGVDQRRLVDILYVFVHTLDTLTRKLDADGTVTDTDYHALWDTANILLQVENSKGEVAGNALTTFNP